MSLMGMLLAVGCSGKHQQPSGVEMLYLTPMVVLPSLLGSDELAKSTSIPSVAGSDWLKIRNASVLGGPPPVIQGTMLAEREMRDIQRITSGRPYGTLRYTVRTRTLLP